MNKQKGFTLWGPGALTGAFAVLAPVGFLMYAVFHFLMKLW